MTDTTQPLKVSDNQYFDLIRRAAILQREFLGVNETERFKNDDEGEVIYTLDTDVFACYANSLLTGPLTGVNRNGYGQLLPRRYDIRSLSGIPREEGRRKAKSSRFWEDHNAVILARSLADTALKRRKCEVGAQKFFLQLDAHFEETSGMLASVKRKVADFNETKAEAQRNNLKNSVVKAFSAISGTLSTLTKGQKRPTAGRFLDFLVGQIMHREMLSETGPFYEAANYNELGLWGAAGKGRMRISEYRETRHDAFYSFNNSQHNTARPVLRLLWGDLLANTKTKDKKRAPDVEALTELTILNKHLFRSTCDWGEDPVRIVFLTGDIGLLEACYQAPDRLFRQLGHYIAQAFPDANQSDIFRKKTELERYFGFDRSNFKSNWFDRFSLHYVRHIRAFSREVLFDKTDQPEEHIGDIFDGLFAGEARKLMRSRRSLERLVRFPKEKKMPENIDQDFGNSLDKWNALVTRAVGKKGLDGWLNNSYDNGIIKKVTTEIVSGGESDTDWKTVARQLFELVDRVRDDTMLSLSGLGAETLGDVEVTYPPDLYFDSLENCKSIFKQLATTPGYLKSPSLFQDFERIANDCNAEDSSLQDDDAGRDKRWEQHLKFLVLGAVFASAQKWSVAEEHARRAIGIIDRVSKLGEGGEILTKKRESNPSGREAYFLRTVCARIRAQDSDALNKASEHLKKARDAFGKDLRVAPDHLLKDLIEARFRNEELSIALAQYYQARREIEDEQATNDAGECDEREPAKKRDKDKTSGEERRKKTKAICCELASSWQGLKNSPEIDRFLKPENEIPEQLAGMYISLNILQLATISEFWENEPEDKDENFRIWKENTKNVFASAVEKKCVEKAYHFLKTANSDDNTLRSTKMGKAYEVSGALLLNKELPDDCNNEEAVKTLFHELLWEARANQADYDRWRVEKLEDFILAGIN